MRKFRYRAFFNHLLRAVPVRSAFFLRYEMPYYLLKTPKTHAV